MKWQEGRSEAGFGEQPLGLSTVHGTFFQAKCLPQQQAGCLFDDLEY